MNQTEKRQVAIGAARSEARAKGFDPKTLSANSALDMLDDIARVEPKLIASIWYINATDNQFNLFSREWKKWQNKFA